MNNMAKNWKSIIFYILIPVLLIAAVWFLSVNSTDTSMKYSQIVEMFDKNEIKDFELDLSSGALTYTLVGSATGTYGQIQLNADGTYTYTLTSAPKTTPNANDGANTLSESFTYQATDALGNSTTSTLVVNIVDDVPKAVASDRSVAAVEIDSNILIVLDISGSMADASGVPGLSRLALAKQAISALLDKYDDLGDVKVQLVTFSSSATDRTSVWVDIATAKTILAGLTAGGGTNYDDASGDLIGGYDRLGIVLVYLHFLWSCGLGGRGVRRGCVLLAAALATGCEEKGREGEGE